MRTKQRSANVFCLDQPIDYARRHELIDQAFWMVPEEHRHTAQLRAEAFNGYIEYGVYWQSPATAEELARDERTRAKC